MRTRCTIVVLAGFMLALASSPRAFWKEEYRWAAGPIVVYLQQGAAPGALMDGSPDWDFVTEGSLNLWNASLNGIVFQPMRDPAIVPAIPSTTNDVSWGDDVYGEAFGDGVLAVTLSMYTTPDNTLVESDIVFNKKASWNSYRGNLQPASGGGTVQDLRRVGLHELGHFIGLGHPDDHGETVVAIMNSHISNTDALQPDDIGGAAAIYGPRPASSIAVPGEPAVAPADAPAAAPLRIRRGA